MCEQTFERPITYQYLRAAEFAIHGHLNDGSVPVPCKIAQIYDEC